MYFTIGDKVEVISSNNIIGGNYTVDVELIPHIGKQYTVAQANILWPSLWGAIGCFMKETGEDIIFSNLVLRLIKPPEEVSTWSELEQLTEWNPLKIGVYQHEREEVH